MRLDRLKPRIRATRQAPQCESSWVVFALVVIAIIGGTKTPNWCIVLPASSHPRCNVDTEGCHPVFPVGGGRSIVHRSGSSRLRFGNHLLSSDRPAFIRTSSTIRTSTHYSLTRPILSTAVTNDWQYERRIPLERLCGHGYPRRTSHFLPRVDPRGRIQSSDHKGDYCEKSPPFHYVVPVSAVGVATGSFPDTRRRRNDNQGGLP